MLRWMRLLVTLLVLLSLIPVTVASFPIPSVSANDVKGSVACDTEAGLEGAGHLGGGGDTPSVLHL